MSSSLRLLRDFCGLGSYVLFDLPGLNIGVVGRLDKPAVFVVGEAGGGVRVGFLDQPQGLVVAVLALISGDLFEEAECSRGGRGQRNDARSRSMISLQGAVAP
jgi:hypothetical protein